MSQGITSSVVSLNATSAGILRTATNDNAPSGTLGEYYSAVQTTYTNVTSSNTFQNAVTLSLPAGDWVVDASASFIINGATMNGSIDAVVSLYSANTTTDHSLGDNWIENLPPTSAAASSCVVAGYRLSLSATTTVYFKVTAGFSAGNPQFKCRVSARAAR